MGRCPLGLLGDFPMVIAHLTRRWSRLRDYVMDELFFYNGLAA
jgi:hypothetical protein